MYSACVLQQVTISLLTFTAPLKEQAIFPLPLLKHRHPCCCAALLQRHTQPALPRQLSQHDGICQLLQKASAS
jgi:hypothetical protein